MIGCIKATSPCVNEARQNFRLPLPLVFFEVALLACPKDKQTLRVLRRRAQARCPGTLETKAVQRDDQHAARIC
jgi:hypothetical protein